MNNNEKNHINNNINNGLIIETSRSCISQTTMKTLFEMRSENTFCDATIVLDDGVVFNVHRLIISSCSEYFCTMFTTKLNEGVTDMKVPGIKSSIMKKILDYAYLRTCEMNEDDVFEIYITADYFLISGLSNVCIKFMTNMLAPKNCIKIMMFARFRNFYKLYNSARIYVLRYFIDIISTNWCEEFLKLNFNDLFDIISDDMLNTKDEAPVWEFCLRWVDYKPNERIEYITQLLRGVRLGLLNTSYFQERVRDHPYILGKDEARPLIIEALKFHYDLDTIYTRQAEMLTPDFALPRLPHDVIFTIGGWCSGSPKSYIETYDTRADRWIQIPDEDPDGPRAYHGTAVICENIYCIGGFNGMEYFNTCRQFNTLTKEWKEIAPMHCRRCYVSVTELNGLIYALGGYDGRTRLNTVEKYDPNSNQWTMMPSMNNQRSDGHACTINDLIYIAGGFNGNECLDSVEFFDPQMGQWTHIANMLSRRSGVSCIGHNNYLYALGGFNGIARLNSCERYDILNERWQFIKEMYYPRSNFGIAIIDDMIFAIGGFNGLATTSHTECYVPETNEWLEATNMTYNRSALSANVVKSLPNIRDYLYKDRQKLIEERRQRNIENATI